MSRKFFRPRRQSMCTVPGCRNLTNGGDRCSNHAGYAGMTAKQAELKQFLNSTAWLKLRSVKLVETPWCEYCAEAGRGEFVPAVDVDHVLPRHSHPELRLTKKNLKSACESCHSKKTARGE